MENVSTYNPRKITAAFGSHIVSGFADDSFITIEAQGDGTTTVVGADGEVVRNIDPSTHSVMKLSLLPYSKTNKFLIEQVNKDKESGTGTFPVTVKDLLGKTVYSAGVAWVPKLAAHGYGKTATNKEWEIHTGASSIEQS